MKHTNSGNELLLVLEAFSNPYRLKIISILSVQRQYVSQLARELGISRPLLYLHLAKLEQAGLVHGHSEIGPDGKAMKYFELVPFAIELTPALIHSLIDSLSIKKKED